MSYALHVSRSRLYAPQSGPKWVKFGMPTHSLNMVELPDGWWSIEVPGVDHAIDVLIKGIFGKPEIVGLRIRPGPVSDLFEGTLPYSPDTEEVADVSLRELWNWEKEEQQGFLRRSRRPVIDAKLVRSLHLAELRQAVVGKRGAPEHLFTGRGSFERGTPRRLSDDFLREVANVYRAACSRGERPRPVIAAHFKAKDDTVKYWLRVARKRELLGHPEGPGVSGYANEEPEASVPDEVEAEASKGRRRTAGNSSPQRTSPSARKARDGQQQSEGPRREP